MPGEHRLYRVEALVRHRDREVVLQDLPVAVALGEHAAAARRAEPDGVQVFVEVRELGAVDRDVATCRAERPGLASREVRVRVGGKRGLGPTLGRVGAEEDRGLVEVPEVARLVGLGGGVVPVVEHGVDGADGPGRVDVDGRGDLRRSGSWAGRRSGDVRRLCGAGGERGDGED